MNITLGDWLGEEPFGMTLSSGLFGFFAHAGVAFALEQTGHSPVAISGSSAGALVGAGMATRIGASRLRDELFSLERRDFWDPFPGLGLLLGRLFEQKLRSLMPVLDLSACANPFRASVFDVLLGKRWSSVRVI